MKPEELILHADFMRRLARRLLLDEHSSEDLVQDALVAGLEKPPADQRHLRAWLLQVARNMAGNFVRSEVRREQREKAAASRNRVPSTEQVVEREEIRRKVVESLLDLSEPYRAAVLLRFYEDMPPRKAARELDVPLETVKTRLKRGLAMLRQKLDRDFGGDRSAWSLALAPLAGIDPASLAAAATSPFQIGALAMSIKIKVGVAAALLLGLTVTLYCLFSGDWEEQAQPSKNQGADSRESALHSPANGSGELDRDRENVEKEAVASSRWTASFSGRILARETGEAVAGADVEMTPAGQDSETARCLTDGLGRFSLAVAVPERGNRTKVCFRIRSDGFKTLETDLPCMAENRRRDDLLFFLDRNEVHAMQVLDTSGKPVIDAKAEFYLPPERRTLAVKHADLDGIIRVTDQELGILTGKKKRDYFILRVTAPGMAEFYDWTRDLLDSVTMDSEGAWSFMVKDQATGDGIPGARIQVRPYRNPDIEPWFGFEEAVADGTGTVRMPRFSLSWRTYLEIRIEAQGYMTRIRSMREFWKDLADLRYIDLKDEIFMQPAHAVRTVHVRDASTGAPLAYQEVRLTPDYDGIGIGREVIHVTDSNGCFECLSLDKESSYRRLRATGFCELGAPFPHPDSMEETPWVVDLTARAPECFRFLDASGRSCAGITVDFRVPQGGLETAYLRQADGSGLVEFNPPTLSSGDRFWIRIHDQGRHHTFRTCRADPFLFGSTGGMVREVVLDRGTLLQGIRVEKEDGSPAAEQTVMAALTAPPGIAAGETKPWTCSGVTNEAGLCDLVFPEFTSGTIGVEKRPDTEQAITMDDVTAQKRIVLRMGSGYLSQSGIQGRVQDEAGRSLVGVRVFLESVRDRSSGAPYRSDKRKIVTGPDGIFRTPIEEGQSYRLFILSFRHGEGNGRKRWIVGEERHPVAAGADLLITLASWSNLVSVSVTHDASADNGFRVWLEDGEGQEVRAGYVKKGSSQGLPDEEDTARYFVSFYGVPKGRLCAAVRTAQGKTVRSPLFDVQEGEDRQSAITVD